MRAFCVFLPMRGFFSDVDIMGSCLVSCQRSSFELMQCRQLVFNFTLLMMTFKPSSTLRYLALLKQRVCNSQFFVFVYPRQSVDRNLTREPRHTHIHTKPKTHTNASPSWAVAHQSCPRPRRKRSQRRGARARRRPGRCKTRRKVPRRRLRSTTRGSATPFAAH